MTDPGVLIRGIADGINQELDRVAPGWETAAVVFEFEDDNASGNFGYAFLSGGRKPFALDDAELEASVSALRGMMPMGTRFWIRGLFQLFRGVNALPMQFEFDRPDRWAISPSSVDRDIEALRPQPIPGM